MMELLSEFVPFLFVLGILVVVGAPVAAIVLGVLLVEARRRIRVLTDLIGILETRLASGTPPPSPPAAASSVVREPQATAPAATAWLRVAPSPTSGRERHLAVSARSAAQRPVFLGGHTLVRVGVILLFFGFSFFLSYVAERGWFPIELRLSAAVAAGVALLAVGWRLRESRREYSLALQGCGAGIVYLTAFAAVNYYAVVGAGVGLGVMSVLVALTATLAVRQDAPSLAVLASLGGFLAPVLVTWDVGHVALFSYYAVLDAGIVTIAWFRAWRLLNLLGFVFTFVVGAWWGAAFYRPPYFTTTQPFLALFFALFVTGPVLQARRQPLRLAEYVDRTLVVGVPVTAFFLQYRLVSGFENGPAASALAFCVFYAVVAALLRRLGGEWTRVLTESFAALSAAFAALAISLAAGRALGRRHAGSGGSRSGMDRRPPALASGRRGGARPAGAGWRLRDCRTIRERIAGVEHAVPGMPGGEPVRPLLGLAPEPQRHSESGFAAALDRDARLGFAVVVPRRPLRDLPVRTRHSTSTLQCSGSSRSAAVRARCCEGVLPGRNWPTLH